MSLQLLSQLNDNFNTALVVHKELSDSFLFIGLQGYSLWNEYQYLSELLEQRRLKRYMTTTYHMCVPDKLPTSANIVEPFIGNINRKTLKMETVWEIAKELFKVYQKWEESTLKKMQRVAAELLASGEVSAFNFVGEMIKDVKDELDYLNNKIIEISAHGWDMPQIVGEQPDYIERYEYLIRGLLGKSKEYHHYNSSLDAISRKTVLDKYPD